MPINPSNLTGLAQTAAPTAHISLFHYRWGMFKSQFILEIISKAPLIRLLFTHVPSNGICRGFTFKYSKFLLPPRFPTALSVPKVPTREPSHPDKRCSPPLNDFIFLWHKFPVNRNNFLILHRHSRVVWLKLPDQPITDRE